MDIRMPVMDGIAATRELTAVRSPPRVLVLTTFDLDDYVYDALRAGASGFLLKDATPEEILSRGPGGRRRRRPARPGRDQPADRRVRGAGPGWSRRRSWPA